MSNRLAKARGFVVIFIGLFTSCAFSDGVEYTLYRSGMDVPMQTHDETLRIHVATVDALLLKGTDNKAKYNRANCEFAQTVYHKPATL